MRNPVSIAVRRVRSLLLKLYPHALIRFCTKSGLKIYGIYLRRKGANASARIHWQMQSQSSRRHREATGAKGDLERYFDARTEGAGIWKWRHYFDIYERHFSRFRGGQVRVLEIGVYSGGSLEMWRDYFGPNCMVYGLDIEPACKAYERNNIAIFIGDQSDRSFWKQLRSTVGPFDIIIDDGGHLAKQQLVTLEETLGHISPGGVYFCEDVAGKLNPYHAYLDGITRELHDDEQHNGLPGIAPNAFQRQVKSIHYYPFVVVIETNEVEINNFIAPKHGTQWQPFFN